MARRTIFAGGRIIYHESAIRILLSGQSGETSADIRRRARAVQKRAQRAAPKRTGALRRSISVNTRYPMDGAVATISATAPHASVIEFGRGVITPTVKKRLWWEGMDSPRGALSVRAVAPSNFMRDSLDAADD